MVLVVQHNSSIHHLVNTNFHTKLFIFQEARWGKHINITQDILDIRNKNAPIHKRGTHL